MKISIFFSILIALIFLFWGGSALAIDSYQEEPTLTPTITPNRLIELRTPTPGGGFPINLNFSCPDGEPAGWGTITPAPYWVWACSACIPGTPTPQILTPWPTGQSTPTPSPTPTITPTPIADALCLSAWSSTKQCVLPTGCSWVGGDKSRLECFYSGPGYVTWPQIYVYRKSGGDPLGFPIQLWVLSRGQESSSLDYCVGYAKYTFLNGQRRDYYYSKCPGLSQFSLEDFREWVGPGQFLISSAGSTFVKQHSVETFYSLRGPIYSDSWEDRGPSYCDEVDPLENEEVFFKIELGESNLPESCYDIGPYDLGFWRFPWVAHVCFQPISLGYIWIFSIPISIDGIFIIVISLIWIRVILEA